MKKAGKRSAAPCQDPSASASYEPTEHEASALDRLEKRRERSSPAPRFKIEEVSNRASLDHPNLAVGFELLTEALGSADLDFTCGVIRQLAEAITRNGRLHDEDINFLIATIKDLKPRDQAETLLVAQMGTVHMAIMNFAKLLGNVNSFQQQESLVSSWTKLLRTYTTQIETLKRYRSGGEQKITVQHVNVNEGAQAIVGQFVDPAKRAPKQRRSFSPTALTESAEKPILTVDTGQAMPVAQTRKREDDELPSSKH